MFNRAKFIVVLGVFLTLLVSARHIYAQNSLYTCETAQVTQNDQGQYVFSAAGCGGVVPPLATFTVFVSGPAPSTDYISQSIAATQAPHNAILSVTENGTYTAKLVMRVGAADAFDVVSTTFEVDDGASALACLDPCDISTTCQDCPEFCEAVSHNLPGTPVYYTCGGGSPLCANLQFNAAGVDSAIGCIPIDDPNKTTSFLIQWSLGVGGGVGLFLIALSGIKIATTKGDEKRLQDARDTFSAAVAGLVLIVLSIFLIRFLTETLLQLF